MNNKKHLFSESSEAMTGMQGTIFEVESFLHENYLFRRNVLSGKTEVAPMAANNGKEPLWKAVTPEVMNSIARHAMKSGVGGSRSSKGKHPTPFGQRVIAPVFTGVPSVPKKLEIFCF